MEETTKMPIILQTRIDNRLIHGQVATIWTPFLDTNLILVANDKAAKDEAQKALLQMSAGTNMQTRFFTIQETIDKIHKASSKQKIFIVVEFPKDVLALVEGGVPIKEVVLGNMHPSEGKKKVTDVIFVNDEDVACFQKMKDLGVNILIRRVPQDTPKDFFSSYK